MKNYEIVMLSHSKACLVSIMLANVLVWTIH